MSIIHEIVAANGDRIRGLLPGRPGQSGWTAAGNRLLIGAPLWIGKTGVPWRDLPGRFGKWDAVRWRFDRWSRKGTWRAVFDTLRDPDLEWRILDSTALRAHPRATGARKDPDRTGGQDEQAAGRSRGGFGTKIRGVVSGSGRPVELLVTPGQDADVTPAEALLAGKSPAAVIGGKGYDKKGLADGIAAGGAEVVLPSRENAASPRVIDADRYKGRNRVERFGSKAKQYRRVATRYEKTARNALGFVLVAPVMVLLK